MIHFSLIITRTKRHGSQKAATIEKKVADSNIEFEEKRIKLQEETQSFMYSQSSKFSKAARALVLGIIGAIWMVSYEDGNFFFANIFVFISLFFGLLYLCIDVLHYYLDSRSYYKEIKALDYYRTNNHLDVEHEKKMDEIFERSHCFVNYKMFFLTISSICLCIGLVVFFFMK